MQICPGLRGLDLLQAFALDPAKQALNAGMTFHIGRAILRTALLRLVVVTLQAEVEFQPLAKLAQDLVVVVGRVDGIAGGVNLVDGNMDVQVVGVVVNGTDPLMIAVPERPANSRLDSIQGGFVGLVTAEADNQVIGLVGLGTGVLDLGVDDLENRRVRPV